jgi:PrtD family type I secretion system ABC transporter
MLPALFLPNLPRRKPRQNGDYMRQFKGDDPVSIQLRASTRRLFGVGIISGAINLLTLSGSVYMLQVYDRVLASRSMATLIGLSVVLLCAYAFQGFFEAARSRMLARIGLLFEWNLQKSLFRTIARLPLEGTPPAAAQAPLRDVEQIRYFLSGMGPTAFLDIPWSPLFLLALFLFHPLIGCVALVGAGVMVAITLSVERSSKGAAQSAAEFSAFKQVMADACRQNAEVVRALGMTGHLVERWVEANRSYQEQSVKIVDVQAALGSAAKIVRLVLQSAILGVGAYLVIIDQASGGIMIASSIMMGRALAPVEVALANWKQLVASRHALERLRSALRDDTSASQRAVALPRPSRGLRVEGLAVTPPGSEAVVVSDVSFTLHAGAAVALLGSSAAGKSSLLKALVGIWPACRGHIRLDGADLSQWASDDLGRHIGYLPQDVGLFDGTVAENIARFDRAATSDAILQAARLAGAHDMILRLRDGYSTRISERGALLSAGQRQRLGLARAVYGNPFLVVLDEPNSNLDADGERALKNAIQAMKAAGRIVILASHRPEVLSVMDIAMVMYGGRLIASGPRKEVFRRVAQFSNAARTSPGQAAELASA